MNTTAKVAFMACARLHLLSMPSVREPIYETWMIRPTGIVDNEPLGQYKKQTAPWGKKQRFRGGR